MLSSVRQMDRCFNARLQDNVLGRVPAEHRDKAYEHKERARRFLSDEYFPPERRDQLVYRFKKVIIECQNHKDYQESMRWLLDTVSEYIGHGRVVADYGRSLDVRHV